MTKKTTASSFDIQGQILVSMPGMKDPRFKDSLILLCGHDENGAMGIVVNKVIDNVFLKDIIDQMDLGDVENIPDEAIHYGGPVEIGRGFVLHTTDCLHKSSVQITDDIALTASTEIFKDVVKNKGPDHMLIALGYAGWSSGQLESELMENSWLTLPADASILFDSNPQTLWERTLKKFGIDPNCISPHAGRA